MLTSRPQIRHEVFRPETYRFDITLTEKCPAASAQPPVSKLATVSSIATLTTHEAIKKTARDQVMPSD